MEKKLKELREKRGFSQANVAQFIGISRQMYNKYESGEVEPSVKAVKMLCKLYNVSYDYLLDEQKTYNHEAINVFELAEPCVHYGNANYYAENTQNYFAQIISLLPKLVYFEKTKILNLVAQSLCNDVEASKLSEQNIFANGSQIPPTYDEFISSFNKVQQMAVNNGFNSKGQKWTREELNER